MLVGGDAVMSSEMSRQGVLVLPAVRAKTAADEGLRRRVSEVSGFVSAEVGALVAAEVAFIAVELPGKMRLQVSG